MGLPPKRGHCEPTMELRSRRSCALAGAARAARTALTAACEVLFWARVVVVLVGVCVAGLVSSTPLLWWSGH